MIYNFINCSWRMLSINDELAKFEKTTFTLNDDTIAIDERFLGGGVTIKDLIQQNSFIISEMRKVKNVFLNYCKLNQKVYKSIMEHEINAANQVSKMNTLTSAVERKLEQTTKEVKKLKEQSVHESHRQKQFMEGLIESLQKQMIEKVDEHSFADKVKLLIEEYDNDTSKVESSPNMSATENEDGDKKTISNQSQKGKKRRGLTAEDIELLKGELVPLIENVTMKVEENERELNEKGNRVMVLEKHSRKHQEDIEDSKNDLRKIALNLDKLGEESKAEDKKIFDEMKIRTSDRVWENKLSQFNSTYVELPLSKLNAQLAHKFKQANAEIQAIHPKISDSKEKIEMARNERQAINTRIDEVNEEIQAIKGVQAQMKEEYTKLIAENRQRLTAISNEITEKGKKDNLALTQQILQLTEKIDLLAKNIEEVVLKRVDGKIGGQMKEIRNDIHSLNVKTKDLKTNLINNGEEVTHVKDVVAKKANFSDLLHFIEKKADKADFKELHDIISSPRETHGDAFDLSESQRVKTRRKATSFSKMKTPGRQEGNLLGFINQTESREFAKGKSKKKEKKGSRPATANTMFVI